MPDGVTATPRAPFTGRDSTRSADTLRALHEHEHQLAAYCPTCERWAVLDLERLIAEGRGDEG